METETASAKRPTYRALTITAILLFVLLNTVYFVENYIGRFLTIVYIVAGITFLVLCIAFVVHLIKAILDKFADRRRLILLGILAMVCFSGYYIWYGIPRLVIFSGKPVLYAHHLGTANCMASLLLTDKNKFFENEDCFGSEQNHGTYQFQNDTIWFQGNGVNLYGEAHSFAVILPISQEFDPFARGKGELLLYRNPKDTLPAELLILENKISKGKQEVRLW